MPNVVCPQCGQRLKVPEGASSKKAKCTSCGAAIVIPPEKQPARLSRKWLIIGLASGAAFLLVAIVATIAVTVHRVYRAKDHALVAKRAQLAQEHQACLDELAQYAPQPGLETPEKVAKFYEARARIEQAKMEGVDNIEAMQIWAAAEREKLKLVKNPELSRTEIDRRTAKIDRDAARETRGRKMARATKAADEALARVKRIESINADRQKLIDRAKQLRLQIEELDRQLGS